MPQIAQQDYLRIDIADMEELTSEEKAKLRDAVARNVLFDTIIVDAYSGVQARPIATKGRPVNSVVLFVLSEDGLASINITE